MTEIEAWFAGRGVWKANQDRLSREKFALIIGGGQVVAVAKIKGVTVHGDRVALTGTVLDVGHPVRDAWIGKPDPVQNNSQNPVGYVELPEEASYLQRPCGCGCGEISTRDFLPGHDVRAMQERVRRLFAGSALEFIEWVDRMAVDHGVPLLADIRAAEETTDSDEVDDFYADALADVEPASPLSGPPDLSEDRREMPSLEPYDAVASKPGIRYAELTAEQGSEQ